MMPTAELLDIFRRCPKCGAEGFNLMEEADTGNQVCLLCGFRPAAPSPGGGKGVPKHDYGHPRYPKEAWLKGGTA